MSVIHGSIKRETEKFIFRYFFVIVLFSTVLIISLAVIYVLLPMYNRVAEKKNVVFVKKQEELISKENVLKRQEDLTSSYNKIDKNGSEVKILNQLLPQKIDLPAYYLQMDNLLSRVYNVALSYDSISVKEVGNTVASPGQGTVNDDFKKIGMVEIEVSIPEGGDYETLKKLLRVIESTMPLLDIVRLTDGAPEFKGYRLVLRTYYLKD